MDTVLTTDISFPLSSYPSGGFLRKGIVWFARFAGSLTESDSSVYRQRYEEVERLYGSLIDRLCFGYSRTRSDFDDLKQDVLMNLWESIPKFRGECSMKTWVYRLTLNVCVTSLRKSYLRVSAVSLNELYDIVDYDPDQKETLAELHDAVGCLNPLDKAIMILWLEEESYEGISRITGLSRNNVAVRIHRAKEKIRTLMEK